MPILDPRATTSTTASNVVFQHQAILCLTLDDRVVQSVHLVYLCTPCLGTPVASEVLTTGSRLDGGEVPRERFACDEPCDLLVDTILGLLDETCGPVLERPSFARVRVAATVHDPSEVRSSAAVEPGSRNRFWRSRRRLDLGYVHVCTTYMH